MNILQRTMQFIRTQAEEQGKEPDEYAKEMLKDMLGNDDGARLGKMLETVGDPVEGLAFLMLEDLKRQKAAVSP